MSTAKPDGPRYATLRDYVRVLRTNRWLILVITVACVGAAYALTTQEKKTYVAQASLFFSDTAQNAQLIGTQATATLPDVTRAQLNAQMITSPAVAAQAKKDLGTALSASALASSVSTYVNGQNSFVEITATSRDPLVAQRLANAFADASKTVARDQARARYQSLANGASAQFSKLLRISNDPVTREVYTERIATLDFLAQTADPVQIVQQAALPTTPAGPHTTRNLILGLLLGLTIALLMAFGRDALDRRLRTGTEISKQMGNWPVLGYVRQSAFGTPLFLNGAGHSTEVEGDRESFRILRQNIRFLNVDDPPRSVVVTSALPEEGKSTVAGSLACASAAAGLRTLLVECDLRRPSLSGRFGLSQKPGLSDFLLGEAGPSDILQIVELSPPRHLNGASSNGAGPESPAPGLEAKRLVCITAGRQVPESAELLNSMRFKQFLRDVEAAYDLVILDASPLLSVADTSVLLPQARATLLCIRAGRTTKDEAAALKDAVDRLPYQLIGVVVTGVRPGTEHDLGYYSYAYAYDSVR